MNKEFLEWLESEITLFKDLLKKEDTPNNHKQRYKEYLVNLIVVKKKYLEIHKTESKETLGVSNLHFDVCANGIYIQYDVGGVTTRTTKEKLILDIKRKNAILNKMEELESGV